MEKVKIYALIHPKTKQIKYIGKTKHKLNVRLSQHISDKNSKTYKFKWISQLKKLELTPDIILIEEVDEHSWKEKETMYIELFKSLGYKLTNTSKGGEGGGAIGHKHTKEFKVRQSEMMKKRNKEKPLSKDFYNQLASRKKKPIIKFGKDNSLLCEYESAFDAAIDISNSSDKKVNKNIANAITASLKGRSKSAHGFVWKYK
jgi:hypothetical protein